MKRRKISALVLFLAAVLLIRTVSFYSRADDSSASLMSRWGARLNEYASRKTETSAQEEINQAKEFYMLSGMDEEMAEAEAEEYMAEREVLYQKAVQSGYGVTDEDIRAYLEELKTLMDSADNKEDVQALIDQFGTEEEYWDYQYRVYEKNLPIQNYVKDLEREQADQ